jgi:hypothetical protein
MDGDMDGGAERAVGVVDAVGVVVRDLYGAEDDDQKDAEKRKEESPGTFGARSLVGVIHI